MKVKYKIKIEENLTKAWATIFVPQHERTILTRYDGPFSISFPETIIETEFQILDLQKESNKISCHLMVDHLYFGPSIGNYIFRYKSLDMSLGCGGWIKPYLSVSGVYSKNDNNSLKLLITNFAKELLDNFWKAGFPSVPDRMYLGIPPYDCKIKKATLLNIKPSVLKKAFDNPYPPIVEKIWLAIHTRQSTKLKELILQLTPFDNIASVANINNHYTPTIINILLENKILNIYQIINEMMRSDNYSENFIMKLIKKYNYNPLNHVVDMSAAIQVANKGHKKLFSILEKYMLNKKEYMLLSVMYAKIKYYDKFIDMIELVGNDYTEIDSLFNHIIYYCMDSTEALRIMIEKFKDHDYSDLIKSNNASVKVLKMLMETNNYSNSAIVCAFIGLARNVFNESNKEFITSIFNRIESQNLMYEIDKHDLIHGFLYHSISVNINISEELLYRCVRNILMHGGISKELKKSYMGLYLELSLGNNNAKTTNALHNIYKKLGLAEIEIFGLIQDCDRVKLQEIL